jgi:UDP-N-acetylglucosamine--N-acetylmuramyl-(pentapeptide) pyrophosphoryl-undecaprenol N-acetylglucosamine transferase
VYPALVVADALTAERPGATLRFVGSDDGMERELVERSGLAFEGVSAGPMHGVNPLRVARSTVKLLRGLVQSLRLVGRFKPDVVFSTGGWASVPVSVAARLRGVPVVAFVPDIEPGRTLKLVGRFSRCVTAAVEDTAQYFKPGKVHVTGYPVRRALREAQEQTREAAAAHFELDPGKPVLLVMGGSQGARSINQALEAALDALLADRVQVLHLSGQLDWPHVQTLLAGRAGYRAFAYLHGPEMGLALAAADLVVSRGGASILGEFTYFGLPAVVVPYPYAWRYQKVNADWLASRGAAVVLADETLKETLLGTVRDLLGAPRRLAEMRARAESLACAGADRQIAQTVLEVAKR